MQVLGKRILVDVERGRTVRGWKPRRLGGGLGGRPKKEPEPFGGRGGLRGGMGGGRGFGDRGGFRFVFSNHAACPSHLTLFLHCRGGFGGGRYAIHPNTRNVWS